MHHSLLLVYFGNGIYFYWYGRTKLQLWWICTIVYWLVRFCNSREFSTSIIPYSFRASFTAQSMLRYIAKLVYYKPTLNPTQPIPTVSSWTWWCVWLCAFFTLNPFFLPVGIQHTQCPCRFFLIRGEIQALWSHNHDTAEVLLHCNAVSRVDNAMTRDKNEKDKRNCGVYV